MQFRSYILILAMGVLATAIPFESSRITAEEKEGIVKLELKDGEVRVTASLTKDDPKDRIRKDSFCKIYALELKAGRTYVIDMVSQNTKAVDPYLRLETSEGKQVAADDDSGGNLNARIIIKPGKDGTYQIIATTLGKQTGDFTLTVQQRK